MNITKPTQGKLCNFISFVLVLAAITGCSEKNQPPPPPPTVEVIEVKPRDMPIFQEWIGTLEGMVNAQIRAQVSGYLLTQNYAEGSAVKKGDLLFEIDPRPFQAVLDQAEAKLAQDKAQQGKTELDVKRYEPLAKEQAISQQELDNAVQANIAAQAQIKADEAAVETSRLNLGFTRIISPIEGLAGIARAQIGDLVGPSGNPLTTVSTIDPIKVYFQVSESSYLTFWRRLVNDPETVKNLPLQLILSDGSVYPEKGKLFFADRQVNPTTGTLQIAGLFPNPDLLLRPGAYGRVRAQIETRTNAIVIPQRAVTEMQGNYQVAVVDNENKAHVRSVQVGDQIGREWLIREGLKAGDRVVVEGLQKAKEGTNVLAKPYIVETNSGATK